MSIHSSVVVAYVSRYALRHRPAAAAASALRERVAPGLACPMSHVPAEARCRPRHAHGNDAETHIAYNNGVWRPTSLSPDTKVLPRVRDPCGLRGAGRRAGQTRKSQPKRATEVHTRLSFTLAAPVLFLGPSSGRHHGMPFFGFLFFFHPGSVWMAPPRLSCRSIDLSWTPSACESCSGW